MRKGFVVMGGDWEAGSGRGSRSSFAPVRYFADENFIVRHSAPGVLSMANSGVHKNGSVWAIMMAPAPQMGEWARAGRA